MFIQFQETPNPATLKFLPGQAVAPQKSYDFRKVEDASISPLAQRLFQVQGVGGVFLGSDFISVTKDETAAWEVVKPLSMAAIMDHLTSNAPILAEGADASSKAVMQSDDPIEQQIIEVLNTRVRPAVAQDGGDIEFHRFENGIVYLAMRGACAGCPSASMTLKVGVERLLQHFVPEVQEVRAAQLA